MIKSVVFLLLPVVFYATYTSDMVASAKDSTEKVFRSLKSDQTAKSEDSIFFAIKSGDLKAVQRYIIDPDVSISSLGQEDMTPLMLAAKMGRVDIVEALLEAGAEVNILNSKNRSAIHYGAASGKYDVMFKLTQYGLLFNTVDKEGKTPLMFAAKSNSVEAVELILKSSGTGMINSLDWKGRGALFYAVKANANNVIGILLQHDVNVDQEDVDGVTPLIQAILNNNSEIVGLLLVAGKANPVLTTKDGRSPMSLAILSGDIGLAKVLIASRPSLTFVAINGISPEDFARNKNQQQIAEYIISSKKIYLLKQSVVDSSAKLISD